MWTGEYTFAIRNLILKDFRIRYRNMSLGVFWSLLNPIVMMGVLTFVFTKILPQSIPDFPLFVLCGLVPFNFFTIAWTSGTTSIVDNAGLIKRVPFPREVIPLASVLSNTVASADSDRTAAESRVGVPERRQYLLVVAAGDLGAGGDPGFRNRHDLLRLCNVYTRDTRYIVESASTLMLWLVPVFYASPPGSKNFAVIYNYNPLAAVIFALRDILLYGQRPAASLLWRLTIGSLLMFAAGFLRLRKVEAAVLQLSLT